jgi:AICAR transformylase/IMP cyclohydrolase PurH
MKQRRRDLLICFDIDAPPRRSALKAACTPSSATTPCGIAWGTPRSGARQGAHDPVSSFGAVIACNTVIDRDGGVAAGSS